MNFQTIPPVQSSKHFLDIAFRRAREKSSLKKIKVKRIRGKPAKDERLQILKKKELIKLDVIKDVLLPRLQKILETFPEEKKLPEFYVQLIKLTLDYPQFKKSFGAVNWAITKLRMFHKEYIRRINRADHSRSVHNTSKQFYGRISSILRQIDRNLFYLEQARKIMKTYPDIKEMPTVCIYGFPNVGKSTLLNKLCGSKAKVASYAFTTVTINAAYAEINDIKIQLLDVPGTLARKEKMNNIELQAELVVEELAEKIIYVFDLSGYSGYSIKKQEELFQKVKSKKKVLVYLAKQDLTDKEVLKSFKHKHYPLEKLKSML